MSGELQWEGFASLAQSGVREALFAAGVDCCMQAQCDAGEDSCMADCCAWTDPE